MSALEWLATGFGLANIILLVRRSIWNFPAALVMVSLYAVIFWQQRLYSDVLLQGFFVVVNLVGWWLWHRAGGDGGPVAVRWMGWPARVGWVTATIIAAAGWGWLMASTTDAARPFWDAGVLTGSVAAQILLTQRYIENWVGWVLVDVLAISLYWDRGLLLTSGLYGLFLILSIVGGLEWRRQAAAQP